MWSLNRVSLVDVSFDLLTQFFCISTQVYIHCKLVVWDPEDLNEKNKACNYNKSIEK